jgi:transposase
MEGLVTMSDKELDRLRVLERVISGALTQRAAAEMLGLTARQVRRLERAYQAHGAGALASKRRGRPSNRKRDPAFRERVIELVRTRYADFGPTLAAEKLREQHEVAVSVDAPNVDGRGWTVALAHGAATTTTAAPTPPRMSGRARSDRRV